MKLEKFSKPVDGSTLTLSRTTIASPSSGQPTSNIVSSRTKWQSVWRYSKSQERWKLQAIWILGMTEQHISRSQRSVQLLTGTSMAIIRNTNSHQWCEYCKGQYGHRTLKGQTIATWVVVGNKKRSYYCGRCVAEITHWDCNCTDIYNCPNRFSLEDQIEIKQPPQVEMSFSNGI